MSINTNQGQNWLIFEEKLFLIRYRTYTIRSLTQINQQITEY